MKLTEWEEDTIKVYLGEATCNWCEGEMKLYGVSKIGYLKVQGVVKCNKCERINKATFVMPV